MLRFKMDVLLASSVIASSCLGQGLEILPKPQGVSGWYAQALSANGEHVAGEAFFDDGTIQKFVLARSGDIRYLPTLAPLGHSIHGISDDGTVLVGNTNDASWWWSEAQQAWERLDDLPTGDDRSHVAGLAGDGSLAVGIGYQERCSFPDLDEQKALTWSGPGLPDQLPVLAGAECPCVWGTARAVSADGSIIVGESQRGTDVPCRSSAVYWQNGTATQLAFLSGHDMGLATAISASGDWKAGFSWLYGENERRLVLWDSAGNARDLGPWRNEFNAVITPEAVSNDGKIVLLSDSPLSRESMGDVWTPTLGVVRLCDWLQSSQCVDISGLQCNSFRAVGIDADGSIVGNVSGNSGSFIWRLSQPNDTDEDGLLDCWETMGIPYVDENGDLQFYELDFDGDGVIDADPEHKDLFVEVDVMDGVPFIRGAIDDVVEAFVFGDVTNPDGITGINLHVLVDETDLPFRSSDDDGFVTFDATKAVHFGTFQEQLDALAGSEVLRAKAKAFRYCLWVNRFQPSDAVGWGEAPGNDFTVAFGGLPTDRRTQSLMASTFMHELGHTLGLHHGGADRINYKPNHVSVMNYSFDWYVDNSGNPPDLDYCRDPSSQLLESSLDETTGYDSPTYSNIRTYFSVPPGSGATAQWMRLDGSPVDWNNDGDTTDQGLAADLNALGGGGPSPGEPLVIGNEWDLLILPIGTGGDYEDGQHNSLPTGELSVSIVGWLDDNVPPAPDDCAADFNGDGDVNTQDVLSFLNAWAAGDPAADFNDDGVVNTQDVLAFLNAWVAGC